MTVQTALYLAVTSQALTSFALGFTRPSNLARSAIALSVAWLTWLFNQAIHDALQSRLHVALLSTGMWIQCLKTFDDLCLTKLSFDEEAKKSTPTSSSRLHFGVSNLWNMRGVGTSKVISQIPCWSYSHGRPSSVSSRGQEMLRHFK